MPRGKEKKAADLSQLADDAMESLNFLYAQGYEMHVDIIRRFITEQGENFRKTVRMQRDVAAELTRQAKEARRGSKANV